MSASAPTAYQLYCEPGLALGSRLTGEEAFFGALWMRNGTSKLTYPRRFEDLDALVQTLLPESRPLEIMDVAVSSGVSTAEWLDTLERAGIDCRMVAGDAVIDAFLLSCGEHMRALVDRTGFLMHLELAGRSIRLPPPRRCGAKLHLHGFNLLRAAAAPLFRLARRRLGRTSPDRGSLACRPLKLVSPTLVARGSIEWIEDDLLDGGPLQRRFHVVRAANVLNRGYFDERTLARMTRRLRERLSPRGLLVVCRTTPDRRNHATVFRLEDDGRFSAAAHLGDGSEIADLVLKL
ncbi:MAG: hypothetical protein ACREU3_18180 [Steroidobacteraceae bacterium]